MSTTVEEEFDIHSKIIGRRLSCTTYDERDVDMLTAELFKPFYQFFGYIVLNRFIRTI